MKNSKIFIIASILFFGLAGFWFTSNKNPSDKYDDDKIAEMITVITATSPVPSIPSTKHIYPAQKSLHLIPALAKCKKIIVFDGIRPGKEEHAEAYEDYKDNILQLTKTDPYFANTQLVFCEEWGHLSGAIEEAMKHVTTPFVFMHQHDLVLKKQFDLNGLIATMVENPNVKYVHFWGGKSNSDSLWYTRHIDEVVEGIHYVPLTRVFGWSDQTHLATADYYRTFVLPQCHGSYTFMEQTLNPAFKAAYEQKGLQAHQRFGAYFYGGLLDGEHIQHTDARND